MFTTNELSQEWHQFQDFLAVHRLTPIALGRAYQNTIAILLLSEFFGNKILFFFHICNIILQYIAILPRRKMQKTMNWKQLLKIIFVNTFFHGINVPKFMINEEKVAFPD